VRTIIIYRETDDSYPNVRSWLADFHRQYPDKIIEEYSPDDPKVDDLIRINELIKFPVITALDDQDKPVAKWMEDMLPKLADVAYYSGAVLKRQDGGAFSERNNHKVIEPPVDDDKLKME
jgi:hypothetical protein